MTLKSALKFVIGLLMLLILLAGSIVYLGNKDIHQMPANKQSNQLRIVSMNVATGNVLPDSLQQNLITIGADIIVIIEWTGNNINLNRFEKAGYQLVLNHPRKKVHGICILSKCPGVSGIVEAPVKTPCTLPLGQFRFVWHDSTITLFAVHAPPPMPSCEGTTQPYLSAMASWIEQGKLIMDKGIGKSGDHLILAGDFNSLPFEAGIKQIRSKQLSDGLFACNMISPTWKPFETSPYLAKIDYIFFSSSFKQSSFSRFSINQSDHLGLVTDLHF